MIITISLVVVALIIGWIIGSSCSSDNSLYAYQDVYLSKMIRIETQSFVLEQENRKLQYLCECLTRDKRLFHTYMSAHCARCDKGFYAKSPDGQDVADMLKNITLTSEEIAKKLDIIIR